jgi:hypothetical protein
MMEDKANTPEEELLLNEAFEKIYERIREDNASLYADLCEAIAAKDPSQHRGLIEEYFIDRIDLYARWHSFLVPGIITVDGYHEMLAAIEQLETRDLAQRLKAPPSARFKLKAKGRVARWFGKGLERARTWKWPDGKNALADIESRLSPRSIINNWIKTNDLKHDTAARNLGVGDTVLYALKKGTALATRRCAKATVLPVAQKIGCKPSELDPDYRD